MLLLTIIVTVLVESFVLASPELQPKIIGGRPIDIFDVPYQASIHYDGKHRCGGSIIGAKFILTAAHCVHSCSVRKMSVNVGGSYHRVPLQRIPVYRYGEHKDYNNVTYDNDIAVLELVSEMSFGPKVLPVALPDQEEILPEGSVGFVSGWGQTSERIKFLSGRLMAIELPVISSQNCRLLNAPKIVTENMICATSPDGGKDSCQGDSGSGFVFHGKLFGITSWGIGCGRSGRAGVYVKVSKYRTWIKRYTGF